VLARTTRYLSSWKKCAASGSRPPPSLKARRHRFHHQDDHRRIRTTATCLDRGLVGDLIVNDVKFDVKPREVLLLMTLLVSWGPMLLLVAFGSTSCDKCKVVVERRGLQFCNRRPSLDESTNPVTFADVAGCDEAKEGSQGSCILKDPSKFQKLGGRIPRGCLPSAHRHR
jgi:cell division protease FtsH